MCAKRKAGDKKHILFSDDFYSDLSEKDMLYAVLVRSPFAYGKITQISFAPKTKIPEGCNLFTYKDIPCKNILNISGTDIQLLCTGEISYKGEILAVITGSDKELLEELKSSVRIELEKDKIKEKESKFSKAYNSLSVSLKNGEIIEQSLISLRKSLLNFSKPDEIIAKRKIQRGNTDDFFNDTEKSEFIIEGIWSNNIQYTSNRETEGALCNYKGGYLHIFTSTLWISNLKELISQSTGIEEDKIIINCTKSSEKNTNSLWQNGILCSLAAIASIKTGKPVKLSLSRSEQEEVIENPSEVKIYHKTAVDKSGIIKAMNIIIDYDSGFYNPFASYILDRLVLASTGIYNCKNVKINARAYKTRRAPSSMYFSQIDSQAFFAIENQIQKIAEITGFSPVELRQMNKAGTLQKLTSPFTFSFGRSSDVINAVAIRSDFKRKYTVARLSGHDRYEADNNFPYSPPQYGIGMACAFEGTGFLGEKFSKEQISMQISVNNDKKIIIHSLPSSARIKEIWTKLILENIETEKRNIIFTSEIQNTSAKTAKIQQIPDNFIGNISIKTILLKKCIDSLKNKKIDGSSYTIKKSIPAARKNLWNQNEFSGTPFYNSAFGACTVELELDKCTYTEKLQKICVIIDAGKIINPKAAENEIHRSIQNCLNFLVKNKTFTCPEIKIQFTQSEEEPKQIGGLIYSILPAAYTSALSQALSSQIEYLPLQTDSIFKYIEKNENNKKLKIEDEQ